MMNSVKRLFLFAFLFWGFNLSAQNTFRTLIPGPGDERCYSIIQTSDSGYVGVGYTDSYGAGSDDVYLFKLNSAGSLLWTETIGDTGVDIGYQVIQTFNGGFAICGSTKSYGSSRIYLITLDAAFNMLWCKTISGGTGAETNGYSIVQSPDSGFVIAGNTLTALNGYDGYIVKVNANGNLAWSRTIGGTGHETLKSITKLSGGGYAACGSTTYSSFGFGGSDMMFVRISDSGVVFGSSALAVGTSNHEGAQSIIQAPNGHYIMAGYRGNDSTGHNDVYIVSLSNFGMEWGRVINPIMTDAANAIINAGSGNFVVAGYGDSYLVSDYMPDMYVLKMDSYGWPYWGTEIGNGDGEAANSIYQTYDGGYIAGGESVTTSSSTAYTGDIFIVKLNGNGETCGTYASGFDTASTGDWMAGGTVDSGGVLTNVPYSLGNGGNGMVLCSNSTSCSVTGFVINNANCYSGCNGSAYVIPGGGTPPYTYLWSPSGYTTQTVSFLCAGSNTCSVTDAVGCSSSAVVTITQPPQLVASMPSNVLSCSGIACVWPTLSGGTPPYQYFLWSPGGQTTDTICVSAGALYACTVWDNNLCSATAVCTVAVSSPINIGFIATNASCPSCSDGTATVIPAGGHPPYTYSWNTTPVQTSDTATGLLPGNYTCCVTDANGCSTCSDATVGFNCVAPTIQATNITFSSVTSNSMTVHWTNGNGNRRIVKIKTTNSFTTPLNGVDYVANPVYLGGEQVVYNGPGDSVQVTGLAPHHIYWFRVYEAICSATNSFYLTTAATGNPKQRVTLAASSSMSPHRPEEETDAEEPSFDIYPNPAHDVLNVECRMKNAELRIFDMTGRVVYVQPINSQLSIVNCQLNAGTYFVKITWESGVEVKRLVIE